MPEPVLPPLAPGQVIRIGPTAGTGTPTRDYGIGATDLCEFMEFPTGILQVCGDSFAGQGVGFGGWYSPIALHVETDSIDDPGGVRYDGVTGVDKPLLAEPTPPGDVAAARGRRADQPRELHAGHHHQGSRAADFAIGEGGSGAGQLGDGAGVAADGGVCGWRQSQISGYYDPIPTADRRAAGCTSSPTTSTAAGRSCCTACTPETFTDRATWQGWSAGPGLGTCADAAVAGLGRGDERAPDRRQDGVVVFQRQHRKHGGAGRQRSDGPGRRAGDDGRLRHGLAGSRGTPPPPEDNRLAQPYGGYISPGSTLDELRVFVSQWNTTPRGGTPYRVIQFAVNPFKP